MIEYEQNVIPSVFSELMEAFNCSKLDFAPRPDIYIKKRFFPFTWWKYSWENDRFDRKERRSPFVQVVYLSEDNKVVGKRRKFRNLKSAGYDPTSNSIYMKKFDKCSIAAEFGHFMRLGEISETKEFDKAHEKEIMFVPVENIAYEPAQPLIRFMQDLPPNMIFPMEGLFVDMSEFFDALAQKFYDSGAVSGVRLNFEENAEYLNRTPDRDINLYRIYTSLVSGTRHLFYVAVEKIKDVRKFLENDPEIIRKKPEQIVRDHPELFKDIFVIQL